MVSLLQIKVFTDHEIMIIFLFLYLSIGILSNIFGPVSGYINQDFRKIKEIASLKHNARDERFSKGRILFSEIRNRILTVLLFPVLYLYLFIKYLIKIINRKRYSRNNWKTSGRGTIHCNICGYNQDIVSLRNGSVSSSLSNPRYQCQSCGKLYQSGSSNEILLDLKCDCGGNLERENLLNCPVCKTKSISYEMSYI